MYTSCTPDLLLKLNLQERSFPAGLEPLLFLVFRLGIWIWVLSFFSLEDNGEKFHITL